MAYTPYVVVPDNSGLWDVMQGASLVNSYDDFRLAQQTADELNLNQTLGGGGLSSNPQLVDIIKEFGVSPGLADNSTAINNSLQTLGSAGLTAWISQPGNYKIKSPIVIGNGNNPTNSTWTAKLLGPGGIYTLGAPPGPLGGAMINYTGTAGAPAVIEVLGPLSGCEIGNLMLQGGGQALANPLANTHVLFNSVQQSHLHDLYCLGAGTGLHCQSSNGNLYHTLFFKWGAKAGGGPMPGGYWGGIWFDVEPNGHGDTFLEEFQNVWISAPSGTSGSTHAFLYYGPCDNVKMRTLRMTRSASADTMYAAVYDYTYNSGWPSDCNIDQVDFDAGITPPSPLFINVGTSSGGGPNRITNISAANGGGTIPPDPGLANLVYNSPSALMKGTTTLVAGSSGTIANTKITANSLVKIWNVKAGGTVGALSVTLSAGTGFTINSTSGTDTSKVLYEVIYY